MRTLIRYEIKKMLARRSTWITCLLLLLCIGTMSFVLVSEQSYFRTDGTELSGIPAIHAKRKTEHAQAGPLTSERLKDIMYRYQTVYGNPENYDSISGSQGNDVYLRNDVWVRYIQPERGILNLIRQVCAPASDPRTYDMNALSHVTDEMAYHFYEIRHTKVQEILDMDYTAGNFTQLEKDTVMKREQQIAAPFEYDYADGWKVLLTRIFSLLFLLTGVAVCIIISPLFSYEYQTGTDAVILSAKCGRRETVLAKIIAGILITSMIYTSVVLICCASVLGVFGIQGWNCDFQILSPTSFYSMKIWQVVLLGLMIDYVVVLSVMAFTMLLSAVCKTPFAAVIISTLGTIVPMFLPESKTSSLINHILSLLPAQAVDIYSVFSCYILFPVGRVVLTLPCVILIAAAGVAMVTLPITHRQFCRHQVV